MTSTHRLIVVSLLSTTMLTGCVVWQSDYDKLQSQNQQLQQQLAASQQQSQPVAGSDQVHGQQRLAVCAGKLGDAAAGSAGHRQLSEETGTDAAEPPHGEWLYR